MYKIIVWTILKDKTNNKILLLKKADNDEWTFAGGHVEDNESIKAAVIKKIRKELNVETSAENLKFICIIDRKMDEAYKLHVFFEVSDWQGAITNNEPTIHNQVEWFDLNSLPDNIGPLALSAIGSISTSKSYHFVDEPNSHNKH